MAAPFAAIDTNSTGVTTETLVDGLVAQVPSMGGATHLWKASVDSRVNSTVAGDMARLRLRLSADGTGTEIKRGQRTVPLSGGSGQQTLSFFGLFTTSGTPHVCVTNERAVGTGSVCVAADTVSPAYLLLEDMGVVP